MKPAEAIKRFESKYPDREVKEIRVLKDSFFITAPMKNSDGTDYSDPFFVLNSRTGEIVGFIPTDNMELFGKIMSAKAEPVK